jgi:hypothetical protein
VGRLLIINSLEIAEFLSKNLLNFVSPLYFPEPYPHCDLVDKLKTVEKMGLILAPNCPNTALFLFLSENVSSYNITTYI